ncbi:MAG: large-conductance mechanosensitive channel protein MscL [Eubacteriales bacterium]|nr:large-conductance mechanosensitive channel protein MscL [Eubacteriales bacterium]
MKKFLSEFKEFAMRGNVIDLAIGVVIGGAFGKITTSLVNDIIMPLISMITGGIDFSTWKWILKAGVGVEGDPNFVAEVAVNFGNLIAVILDFIIIAFVIFLMIKAMNRLHKKEEKEEEAKPEEPAAPTSEELLTEIRDLLKEQNK